MQPRERLGVEVLGVFLERHRQDRLDEQVALESRLGDEHVGAVRQPDHDSNRRVGQQLSEAIEKGPHFLFRPHDAIRVKVAMPGNSDDEGCEVLWRRAGQKRRPRLMGRRHCAGTPPRETTQLNRVHAQQPLYFVDTSGGSS